MICGCGWDYRFILTFILFVWVGYFSVRSVVSDGELDFFIFVLRGLVCSVCLMMAGGVGCGNRIVFFGWEYRYVVHLYFFSMLISNCCV